MVDTAAHGIISTLTHSPSPRFGRRWVGGLVFSPVSGKIVYLVVVRLPLFYMAAVPNLYSAKSLWMGGSSSSAFDLGAWLLYRSDTSSITFFIDGEGGVVVDPFRLFFGALGRWGRCWKNSHPQKVWLQISETTDSGTVPSIRGGVSGCWVPQGPVCNFLLCSVYCPYWNL